MATQQELLTTQEVAERLGKHINTVRRWCREGEIPSKKIGRTLYIPKSAVTLDIEQWRERKRAA